MAGTCSTSPTRAASHCSSTTWIRSAVRRVSVRGGPYAIAYDHDRRGLWIALTGANELVYYAAGSRPVIRQTVPSIRNARAVMVDAQSVTVIGQNQQQTLSLPAAPSAK